MKTLELSSIEEELCRLGWSRMNLAEEAGRSGLSLLFRSPLAVLGLVLVSKTKDVIARWGSCQDEMSKLRQDADIGRNMDLYLVFVVELGDPGDESGLNAVLSDTHVCRKLYIPMNGREVAEAFSGIPCLQVVAQLAQTAGEDGLPLFGALDLPEELKRDLATRAPDVILNRLLNGEYGKEALR